MPAATAPPPSIRGPLGRRNPAPKGTQSNLFGQTKQEDFSLRPFVGLVQPPQSVAQIAWGTNLKRKPALSGSNARVLERALLQILGHGIEPENDGIGSVESPRDRKAAEDLLAAIQPHHPEHGLGGNLWPAAHLRFQHRRPPLHFLRNRGHFRPVPHASRALPGGPIPLCLLRFHASLRRSQRSSTAKIQRGAAFQ